jgi:aromatic-L-amino-acid decarboxylase
VSMLHAQAAKRIDVSPVQHHRDVWLHVDAAWAGVSFACPEYRQQGQLDAINTYADSFCTNFHKVRSGDIHANASD